MNKNKYRLLDSRLREEITFATLVLFGGAPSSAFAQTPEAIVPAGPNAPTVIPTQVNAAIYAKNLNVVAGANAIGHDTLDATPIAGVGAVPGVSIDVSNLGSMYASRIVLVGNENGVGVSSRGVLAAQAGDLVPTSEGKLLLAGQSVASGNVALNAREGIDSSGTIYAQQNVSARTSGALIHSGVLAAQHDASISAGSVASSGTLGAGVNGDGTIADRGNLSVSASGAVTATGRNSGGGEIAIAGTALNLAGSHTTANDALALTASRGDLDLSGAAWCDAARPGWSASRAGIVSRPPRRSADTRRPAAEVPGQGARGGAAASPTATSTLTSIWCGTPCRRRNRNCSSNCPQYVRMPTTKTATTMGWNHD
ncbi:hemagglutinin-like protein [Paraburkholderia rhizosphaerae]|uniref:Hemagglutinin-like protein n=1 Tax=Paraburkholderia rhizosphaerae TaxID=480658 RepID=A0A4R8LLH3_9BURK|nr:hemagglutinin-like protein [Paraburkholderia rhizosphaerae]